LTEGVQGAPIPFARTLANGMGPKSGMTGRVTVPSTTEGLFLSYESGWLASIFVTKKEI
jgi:hypothetical protein